MEKTKHRSKKKTALIIIGAIVLLLIGFRLWLPGFVLKKVNEQLGKIDGYEGHVEDIDLLLIAGEYSIKHIELIKTGGKIPVPFFAAERIDLSVEWKALFKGELVGEIEVTKPVLNYVKGPTKETTQTSIDKDWTVVVKDLMPLKINRFEVKEGQIHYRDFHSKPKVNLEADNLFVLATNLTNADDNEKLLPATVVASAQVYEGEFNLNMKINPLNKQPIFDLNAELTSMNLVHLNNFLKAYGNFDVAKGTFGLYAEAATRNNKILGYAKPIIKDIDVAQWNKEEGDVLQTAWESVVEFAAWVFENKKKDQLATEVRFEGNLNNPDVDLWSIIGETLQNAFIKALLPSLENNIYLGSLSGDDKESKLEQAGKVEFKDKPGDDEKKEGFLKRIFGKKDKEKKDKKEKENKQKQKDGRSS